ncbi:MAG: SDR family NAD(P)-dependent oxidoreductase [Planctomycetota bacterium]|jgi:3-oxoacyl-[acyl-carrier protein] reductase
MNSLKNKKVFVTGGASGIGEAIVREFAALGAEVAIHYFSSSESAEKLAGELNNTGGSCITVGGDLTKEEDVKKVCEEVKENFGYLDCLVNNTGDLIGRCKLEDMEFEFYQRVIAVNMDSTMLVTRECLPMLKGRPDGASIVNLSSLAGRKGGHAGSLVYSAAKGAVLTWTRSLSEELAADGIRVNAVAPGLILGSRFHATHTTEESKNKTIAGVPVGRAGNCEDVARAVVYLASETNGFITGATLDINGGVYCA